MPDTSPTPVDTRELLRQVIDDAVLTHTGRSVGDVASGRVADDVLAELRTLRASIGPDSERIRELEAEVAKLDEALTEELTERDRLTDLLDQFAYSVAPLSKIGEHTSANDPWANALGLLTDRAAGLLPGPDDIVVSRELAEKTLRTCEVNGYRGLAIKWRAALSQPHPEETP